MLQQLILYGYVVCVQLEVLYGLAQSRSISDVNHFFA